MRRNAQKAKINIALRSSLVKKEEVVCSKDCKSEIKISGVIGKRGSAVGLDL